MRKSLLTLLAFLAAMSAKAQQDTLRLGFCNGEVATASDYQLAGKGWIEGTLRLPVASLRSYAGNSIVGVRAGLAARLNTDTLKVWIRKDKEGPNLAEGCVVRNGTAGIVKGWNPVCFASPYLIPTDGGELYVGYSLHQKGNVKAVSLVTPALDNASFVKLGDEEWQDVSTQGVISIEALVSGDRLADYDLGLGSASVTPVPSEGKNALRVTATLHNYGLKSVTGFTIASRINGLDGLASHISCPIASMADSTVSFVISPSVAVDEQTPMTLTLAGIDGAADACSANDTVTPTYKFSRHVLIEEFTTEYCSNCPRVAGFLHTLLPLPQYKGKVSVVAHHAGFNTDWLTQPCDEPLVWLYNEGGRSYAPALGYDRQPYFDATYNAGQLSPFHAPSYIEEVQTVLDHELRQATEAMIDVSVAWNSDSTRLTATVEGVCTSKYDAPASRVCVFLLENDVKAKNQAGATGDFYHQHVTRAYNDTWGEPVEWADRRFTLRKDFTVQPSWVKSNMEVVAFLYNYDSADPTRCSVDNAASAPIVKSADASAITTVRADVPMSPSSTFDVMGRRVDDGSRGLRIVRMGDGTVRKEWRK